MSGKEIREGRPTPWFLAWLPGRMECSFSATDSSLGGQVGRHDTSGIQLEAWEV